MNREALLDDVLALVASRQTAAAQDLLVDLSRDPGTCFRRGLTGFVAFMASDHDTVELVAGEIARQRSIGPDLGGANAHEDALLMLAVQVLAGAVGRGCPGLPDEALDALVPAAAAVDPETVSGAFLRYLATEAALAAARLDVAQDVSSTAPAPHVVWSGHAYAGVMLACTARLAAFTGDITRALELLDRPALPGLPGLLVVATHALAAASAADFDRTETLVADVEQVAVDPEDHLSRGVHLLLAFAAAARGDTRGAVRHLLDAGGGADLEQLTIIDRVLGYELLVNVAIDDGDLSAATAWAARADAWEAERVAAPTVERIRSRVALLAGDVARAEDCARRAVGVAAAERRRIEQAEAEIVLARVRIARANVLEAVRDLRAAVVTGDASGHHALRIAATRELRPARRRLPPPAGAGWASLSAREAEVASLILLGATNAAIAEHLHLSRDTVRTHVTRVLTAFRVATRIAFLAAVNQHPSAPVAPPDLTARQAEVVRQLALGHSNADIASDLGIQVKSVEDHVSEVFRRWDLTSRFDVAHRWWQLQGLALDPMSR